VKTLVLTSDPHGPSFRFRVGQYLPHLRRLGWCVDTAAVNGSLPQRLTALARGRHYECVWLHRVLLTPVEHALLRAAAPRYVFEFDDAVDRRDSNAPAFASRQRRARFARMVRGATRVVAGNAYLAGLAAECGREAAVLPTAVDVSAFPLLPAADEPPTIGWIGTRSNFVYLRSVLPALARAAERRPDLRLLVVSDGVFEAGAVPVCNKRWSLAEEAADLARMNVGIMPLPDDPWTRGKCGAKLLQYFAAARPAVCSPVGAAREIVEHGVSGYLAATEKEWAERLLELLDDASKRRRFGAAGRARVERDYSLEAVLPRLIAELQAASR